MELMVFVVRLLAFFPGMAPAGTPSMYVLLILIRTRYVLLSGCLRKSHGVERVDAIVGMRAHAIEKKLHGPRTGRVERRNEPWGPPRVKRKEHVSPA